MSSTKLPPFSVVNEANKVAASVGGQIKISDFDFDFDKDGKVDAFEQKIQNALKAADTDGSGTLTQAEFVSVLRQMADTEKQNKNLGKKVTALSVLSVVLLLLLTAVSVVGAVVGGNSIKESHVDGTRVMTDKTGEAVGVATAVEAHGLWTLPTLSVEVLGNFKTLMFYIDMTANPEVGTWSVASTRPTTMYKKSAEKLVLVTSEGFKITVDSKAKVGSIEMSGVSYPIAEEAPPTSRRSLQALMDPEPAEGAPPMRRRRLRRGGLSTQGSFTMTAGSNDNLTGDGR
jgi:hypothetical protein